MRRGTRVQWHDDQCVQSIQRQGALHIRVAHSRALVCACSWYVTRVHRWALNSSSAPVAVRTMSTRALAVPRWRWRACCATPRRSAWASRFQTRAWPGVCCGRDRRMAPVFFVQAKHAIPSRLPRSSMLIIMGCAVRRIGRRRPQGGRVARGELQPGQRHARDLAQDLSGPSGGDGQSIRAARPQRHHWPELLQHHGCGGGAVPPALGCQHEHWRYRRGARGLVAAPIHNGSGATAQPTDDHDQRAWRATTSRFATQRTFSRHYTRWQRSSRCIKWNRWGGGQHVCSREWAHGRRQ